jgi:hypothetical protein
MSAIQDIELPQHDLRDFTLYSFPAREKDRLRKPLYPQIGKWLITGVLHRSDCAETCLAENIKTGKPAVLSYLIPRAEFDYLSGEYKSFVKAGNLLAAEKRVRFLPEGKIKRAACHVQGYRTRITGPADHPISEHRCAACDRDVSAESINSIRAMSDCYSCACGNEIRMKYIDVTVPVMLQKYKDNISLKRALITAKAGNCAIPSVIFCRLIGVTVRYFLRVAWLPVLTSSRAIALCADGTASYLYTPAGRAARKCERRDVPAHIARFFDAFLECCPDVSPELARFMALPNGKTLRSVRKSPRSATQAQVRDWLGYVAACGTMEYGEANEVYLSVQEMIVPEWQKNKPSLDQVLSATDATLHPGEVSLSDLQKIQTVENKRKTHTEKKIERKRSWQRYLERETAPPRSAIEHLTLLLRSVPVWQKYAFAGVGSMVILFMALFSGALIVSPSGKPGQEARAVLRSSPARLIRDTVSDELHERISSTVATARILVSDNGRVEKVEWVYATNEQQNAYSSHLEYLKFDPAKQNGSPSESWLTIQLPIREKSER